MDLTPFSVQLAAEFGNVNSLSDAQVGARCLMTGIWGAHKNVLINLPSISDAAVRMAAGREGCGVSIAKAETVMVGRVVAMARQQLSGGGGNRPTCAQTVTGPCPNSYHFGGGGWGDRPL